jgi:thiol-disulfide isomerase/thioredoxin
MDTTPSSPAATPPPAAKPLETARPIEIRRHARLLVPLLVVCALAALFWPQQKGKAAPGGRVEDPAGAMVDLEDRYRTVTLVHFWATWCLPCIEEMPKLQRFAKELEGRKDFALLMVAVADDRKKAAAFLGGTMAADTVATNTVAADTVANYFDDGWTVSKSWGSEKLPETHLVVDGRRVHTFVGAQNWDDTAVRAKVQEALAVAGAAS